MDKYKKLLTAIDQVRIFDFLASRGHEFSKHELLSIAKELAYAYESNSEIEELLEAMAEALDL